MKKLDNKLFVKIMSNNYLDQLEELNNSMNDIKGKTKNVGAHVKSFVEEVKMRHAPKKETLRVGLMWASPFFKRQNDVVGVIKYETKYDIVFQPIIETI